VPFRASPAGVRVWLRVTPKAKHSQFGGLADEPDGGPAGQARALKVAVTAAPEGGKANDAVIALLAREWGVAKSAVSVVSGATGRRKLVEIRGAPQELLARLQGWLAARPE